MEWSMMGQNVDDVCKRGAYYVCMYITTICGRSPLPNTFNYVSEQYAMITLATQIVCSICKSLSTMTLGSLEPLFVQKESRFKLAVVAVSEAITCVFGFCSHFLPKFFFCLFR